MTIYPPLFTCTQIPENPSLGLKLVGVLAGLISWGTMTSFEATASTALFQKFNMFCRKFIKDPKKAICENGQTLIVAIFTGGPILFGTASTVKGTYDAFRPLVGWITYFAIPVHIVRIGMSWIWRHKFQQDLKNHYKRMIACAMCDLENYRLQEMLEGMLKDMGEQRGVFTHTKFRRLAISFNNAYNRQERIELLFRELRKELLRKTGVDIFEVEKQVKSQCCEPWSLVRQCCVMATVVLCLYSGTPLAVAARNLGPMIADFFDIEKAGSAIGAFLAVACYLTNAPLYIVYGVDIGKELAMHIEGLQCCGKENRSGFHKTQAASDWIIKAAGFGLSVGFVATRVGLAGANPLFKIGGSNIPFCLSIVPGSAIFGYRACVNNIRNFYNNNVKAYSLAPSARKVLLEKIMDEELGKAVDQFCRTCCCCAKDVKQFEITLAILRVFIEESHKDLTDSKGELSMILAKLRREQTGKFRSPTSQVSFEDLDKNKD